MAASAIIATTLAPMEFDFAAIVRESFLTDADVISTRCPPSDNRE